MMLYTVKSNRFSRTKKFYKKKDSYYPTASGLPTNPFLKNKIK